jgi:Flp pilus assembly protein TadD
MTNPDDLATAPHSPSPPGSNETPPLGELSSLADVPARVGRYRVEGIIGQGGMGVILRAGDEAVGRSLAVKVLHASHAGRADLVRRFLEEARLTGQLQHPGVPPVHELGTLSDGRPFFAMKLVEGHTLAELLRERTRGANATSLASDLPRFLTIFEQVAQALAYAHSRGVIHRDLKPANVMVGAFGEVQVMDWGLAKSLPGGPAEPAPAEETSTVYLPPDQERTRAGTVLGTPAYMAPEQARGDVERTDERADVFGLGAVLCVILTGYRLAVCFSPDFAHAWRNLGTHLGGRGALAEALACFERVIELNGKDAHAELQRGAFLAQMGRFDEAKTALRRCLALNDRVAMAHYNLGTLLLNERHYVQAVRHLRRAVDLDRRKPAYAHRLGQALARLGRPVEAAAAYAAALERGGRGAELLGGYGEVLGRLGQFRQAEARLRQALALGPLDARSHDVLAQALEAQGQRDRARQHLWAAVKLEPRPAEGWFALARLYHTARQYHEAVYPYRQAVARKPDWPEALCNLGQVLRAAGRFREARTYLRRGHRLGSARPGWRYPSAQWLKDVERLAHLQALFDDVLAGRPRSMPTRDRHGVAVFCVRYTPRRALAARLFAEAVSADPASAADPYTEDRYNAACAAAEAGCGRGSDAAELDEGKRARWRGQALEWLRADLAAWSGELKKGSARQRREVAGKMRHWLAEADLSGVRGEAIERLPAAERPGWQQLWRDVQALLDRAESAGS